MPAPGIKKAFRGDGSGSLLAPQTPMQVAAIFGAEFLGTALLLFMGCMGSMLPLGKYTLENQHLQTAMVFGITVMFVIQIIGHTSVAHINPAVSLCSLILGKIRVVTFGVYVAAQILGAIVGVGLLKAVTPNHSWNDTQFGCCSSCLNIPSPSLSNVQAFLAEFMVTCVLIFLVCGIWDARNKNDSAAPIKFGLTIMGLALAEGNFTGTSMNPARSLGPAIWEGNWERHWVYWAAPLTASVFATLFYSYVLNTDYSRKESAEEVSLTAIKGDGQSASRNAAEPDE
ncbi:hypothetical protein R5R35_007302 [Gryllus longicercus]|uniref:Aquaporin n=1 Tax=Gryllus longicercus TaxID=2509291 RepID=A0AAN9V8U1_9ORTH